MPPVRSVAHGSCPGHPAPCAVSTSTLPPGHRSMTLPLSSLTSSFSTYVPTCNPRPRARAGGARLLLGACLCARGRRCATSHHGRHTHRARAAGRWGRGGAAHPPGCGAAHLAGVASPGDAHVCYARHLAAEPHTPARLAAAAHVSSARWPQVGAAQVLHCMLAAGWLPPPRDPPCGRAAPAPTWCSGCSAS